MTSDDAAVSPARTGSRLSVLWWALAGLAVLGAVLGEVARPVADAVGRADLVAAGVPPAVLAEAEAYRAGLRPLTITSLLLRVAVGLVVLLPAVRRRVAGRLRPRSDRLAVAGRRQLRPLVAGLLGGVVWVVSDLVRLPLQWIAVQRAVDVGLVTQSTGEWLRDWAVVHGPYWLGVVAVVTLVAWLVERRPRDWVPVAGLSLGVAGVALVLLSPLLFEPLLLSFRPLEDPELRADIDRLADLALGEAPDRVLVADASRRTTASNAYVSGLGGTRRIVLYDTLLADAPREQVLAIVAHELAHDANRDLERTAAAILGGSVVAVAAVQVLFGRRLRDHDGHVRPEVAVAIVGVGLVLAVASAPVERWSSRRAESAADATALQLTGDPDTFVAMMVGLAQRNLSDPDPPDWAVSLWFSHPPVAERIGRGLGQ